MQWSDVGKDNTRACTRRAGMGQEVQIISEPQAAVIYTLDAQDPLMLDVGHRFVVVDAGGGTFAAYSLLACHETDASQGLST